MTYDEMCDRIRIQAGEISRKLQASAIKEASDTREIESKLAWYRAQAAEYESRLASFPDDLEMVANRGRQRRILLLEKLKADISTFPGDILSELLEKYPNLAEIRDI